MCSTLTLLHKYVHRSSILEMEKAQKHKPLQKNFPNRQAKHKGQQVIQYPPMLQECNTNTIETWHFYVNRGSLTKLRAYYASFQNKRKKMEVSNNTPNSWCWIYFLQSELFVFWVLSLLKISILHGNFFGNLLKEFTRKNIFLLFFLRIWIDS